MRAFTAIADLWHFDEDRRRAMLGGVELAIYRALVDAASGKRIVELGLDTLDRLSAALGILGAPRQPREHAGLKRGILAGLSG